ncbi:MAG: hypothetical protein RTU92_00220 [Candidatus Thorarchaeota archaeon]
MTEQIPDEFRYDGEPYSLVGMNGAGLYTTEDLGLEPGMASTACYRGTIMYYDCIDGQLVLDMLHIRADEVIPLNGVDPGPCEYQMFSEETRKHLPEHLKDYNMFSFTYKDLKLKTKFTGSILLAKDFINSIYRHMGYQRPMVYRTVLEIQVQDGDIICVSDLSQKMEELRARARDKGAQPDSMSQEDVHEWVEETFSLDYDIS